MSGMLYARFAALAFRTQLAYRSQVWAGIFGELVEVLAKIAIWTAVLAAPGAAAGVSLAEMITYAVIAGTLLGAWRYEDMLREIGAAVKSGDLAVHLLRPLHYPLYLLAVEVGNLGFAIATTVLPVIVMVAVFFGLMPPASLAHGLLFVPFWLLAFAIFFLLTLICGLASFWLMDAEALEWFLTGIIAFFSGAVVPLWFFPPALGAITAGLPFAWLSYYPAAVYLGKLDAQAAGMALLFGGLWALALGALCAFLWAKTRTRLTVQGG